MECNPNNGIGGEKFGAPFNPTHTRDRSRGFDASELGSTEEIQNMMDSLSLRREAIPAQTIQSYDFATALANVKKGITSPEENKGVFETILLQLPKDKFDTIKQEARKQYSVMRQQKEDALTEYNAKCSEELNAILLNPNVAQNPEELNRVQHTMLAQFDRRRQLLTKAKNEELVPYRHIRDVFDALELIDAIAMDKKAMDKNNSNKIILSGHHLVEPILLFSLIHEIIQKQEGDFDEKEALITFSKEWNSAHEGSFYHAGVQGLINQITGGKEISAFREKGQQVVLPFKIRGLSDPNLRAQSPGKVRLGDVGPSRTFGAPEHLSTLGTSSEQENIHVLFNSITTGKITKKKKVEILEKVAFDLMNEQKKKFSPIQPLHLVPSVWRNKEFPGLASEATDFFNKISGYVTNQIITQRDMASRVKMLKFFVNVANTCLHPNFKSLAVPPSSMAADFQTASAILSGINSQTVAKFEQSLKKFTDIKKYDQIYKSIDRVFNDTRGMKNLRDEYLNLETGNEPYIPYLPRALGDVEFVTTGNQVRRDDGQINYEFMDLIKDVIDRSLAPLKRIAEKSESFPSFTTIVSDIKSFAKTADDLDREGYKNRITYEPKKNELAILKGLKTEAEKRQKIEEMVEKWLSQ